MNLGVICLWLTALPIRERERKGERVRQLDRQTDRQAEDYYGYHINGIPLPDRLRVIISSHHYQDIPVVYHLIEPANKINSGFNTDQHRGNSQQIDGVRHLVARHTCWEYTRDSR